MHDHLNTILKALAEAKVKFIICGGLAVVLQGGERVTMDIDLATDFSHENLSKFLEIMKQFGLVPRAPVMAEALLDKKLVDMMVRDKNALVFSFVHPQNMWVAVDVFLTAEMSFDALIACTEEIKLGDYRVAVLTKQKLLELKKKIHPLRAKDQIDIQILESIMKKKYK